MSFQMNIDLLHLPQWHKSQRYTKVLEIIPYFLIDSHDDFRDKNFSSDWSLIGAAAVCPQLLWVNMSQCPRKQSHQEGQALKRPMSDHLFLQQTGLYGRWGERQFVSGMESVRGEKQIIYYGPMKADV